MTMELTGGEVVAKMLAVEGVEKIFGIIDGTYFGFYSKLRFFVPAFDNLFCFNPACMVYQSRNRYYSKKD